MNFIWISVMIIGPQPSTIHLFQKATTSLNRKPMSHYGSEASSYQQFSLGMTSHIHLFSLA